MLLLVKQVFFNLKLFSEILILVANFDSVFKHTLRHHWHASGQISDPCKFGRGLLIVLKDCVFSLSFHL